MFSRCVLALSVAGAIVALPATLSAQAWPPPPPPAKNMDRLPTSPTQPRKSDVEEIAPSQIERAQETEPVPTPKAAAPKRVEKTAPRQSSRTPAHTHTIACEGTFARTSSQLRLENTYKAQNVAFTEVDGSGPTKVTVLFPNDPKQRLEVWWSDQQKRRDIHLIVINGQALWAAPRGVRLGLSLAALEKLNHKPFRLKGLDETNGSQVSDWNGGTLARLPGGCQIGVRMQVASEIAAEVREAAAANGEISSSDAAIRAANPVVAEIIVGY